MCLLGLCAKRRKKRCYGVMHHQVKTFKFPLLGVFGLWAAICMWTATYVTPDPNMPKVFMASDNYERFLPTLAKRYEKTFNPFRLKVRIHIGIDAKDPIDRGTTPDYNDCFFNCAGQKPNYIDVFGTAGSLSERRHCWQLVQEKVGLEELPGGCVRVMESAEYRRGCDNEIDILCNDSPNVFLRLCTAPLNRLLAPFAGKGLEEY